MLNFSELLEIYIVQIQKKRQFQLLEMCKYLGQFKAVTSSELEPSKVFCFNNFCSAFLFLYVYFKLECWNHSLYCFHCIYLSFPWYLVFVDAWIYSFLYFHLWSFAFYINHCLYFVFVRGLSKLFLCIIPDHCFLSGSFYGQ